MASLMPQRLTQPPYSWQKWAKMKKSPNLRLFLLVKPIILSCSLSYNLDVGYTASGCHGGLKGQYVVSNSRCAALYVGDCK